MTPAGSNPQSVDEQELLRRARRGDREAFGRLVSRYERPVFRVIRGVLAGSAESDDVAQEVFLKAYANLARFRGESGFFTWLYRIAVNEALRARRRRPWATTDVLPEIEAPPREVDDEAPSLVTLQRLLGKLDDEHRSIVVLRDIEGLSYREIAETLEVPMGTVESRLFRARQELRALWRKSKETKNAL